jgi:hypothetical protein
MYNSSTAEAATSVIAYRDSLRRGARAVVGPPYSSIAKYLALLGGIDQVRFACVAIPSYPPIQPIQGIPIQGIPIQGIPIQGIPIQGIPIQGIPIPCW